jgi:acyl-coenzyme A thioesterase PaaI-like protein
MVRLPLAATSPHQDKKRRPKPNYCFACGKQNRHGLRLEFDYNPSKRSVVCFLKLPSRYQGATGFAHGGIIATLLDEAMAKVNGKEGLHAMTIRLVANYRKAVPVEQALVLYGRRTARRKRKIYLRSELKDNQGTLLADGRGLFLIV